MVSKIARQLATSPSNPEGCINKLSKLTQKQSKVVPIRFKMSGKLAHQRKKGEQIKSTS